MKKFFLLLIILLIGAGIGGLLVWMLSGTTDPDELSNEQTPQASSARETTVKYVGPMHPQIVRDEPGQCPICGMDLVKKEIKQKTGRKMAPDEKDKTVASGRKGGREILYWVAPMDPNYKRDKPGKSPMGMDLVPVYADDIAAEPGTITIDPVTVNNLGVETSRVKRTTLSRDFRTIAEVSYDERSMSHIHTRVDGWIEKLYLAAPGDWVAKGDPILKIYSPELVTTQEEFLLALQRNKRLKDRASPGNGELSDLVRQSRERLLFFGISEKEIDQIVQTGEYKPTLLLRAPYSGIVTELGVREGMHVTPRKMLYSIADLSKVWVMAHIYASQADWIEAGDRVTLMLPFHPDRKWQSRVDYVYPYMEPMTRTVKARMVFENRDGLLKPNMFATAIIHAAPRKDVLAVPEEAVIRSGKRSVAVIALGEGRFHPVEVATGIESQGLVEIREGLVENQRVVTSGQFLLDAESDLQAGLQRMDASNSEADMSMDHQNNRHEASQDSKDKVDKEDNHHDHVGHTGHEMQKRDESHDHSGHADHGVQK